MAIEQTPSLPLPTDPQSEQRDYVPGQGEAVAQEWTGPRDQIKTKYDEMKAAAGVGGSNVAQISYANRSGRATVVARFGPTENGEEVVQQVEELFAVDVLKDIHESPYFSLDLSGSHPLYAKQDKGKLTSGGADVDKGLPLSDEQVAFVRLVVENRMTNSEIDQWCDKHGLSASLKLASWTVGMYELRFHLLHGVESYYETAFVVRVSQFGVLTTAMLGRFENINTVVIAPQFSEDMNLLVYSLPEGEWLYKPPQVEHLGRGRWRVTREYQWAYKWSIVYGGSWNWSPP
jgi:hypothetical protein